MTLAEFAKEARRDFIEAGPENHFACPAGHATGKAPDGSGCLIVHMGRTRRRLATSARPISTFAFEWAWTEVNGEGPIDTNERGFATCVDAYDQLVLHLEPTTPSVPTPLEAVPA